MHLEGPEVQKVPSLVLWRWQGGQPGRLQRREATSRHREGALARHPHTLLHVHSKLEGGGRGGEEEEGGGE